MRATGHPLLRVLEKPSMARLCPNSQASAVESRGVPDLPRRLRMRSTPIELAQKPTTRRERNNTGPLSGGHPIVKSVVEASVPSARGPVLIVDDERDVQMLLSELLRAEGYEVDQATDGAEALEHLRAATTTLPCLILLDLVMPNVDGWQFLEERRHDPRLAGIPVVLISGQVAARETARALGLAGYVEKPISAVIVRETLARVLANSPTIAQL
jgi:CheY-like chemotaxis protein